MAGRRAATVQMAHYKPPSSANAPNRPLTIEEATSTGTGVTTAFFGIDAGQRLETP